MNSTNETIKTERKCANIIIVFLPLDRKFLCNFHIHHLYFILFSKLSSLTCVTLIITGFFFIPKNRRQSMLGNLVKWFGTVTQMLYEHLLINQSIDQYIHLIYLNVFPFWQRTGDILKINLVKLCCLCIS